MRRSCIALALIGTVLLSAPLVSAAPSLTVSSGTLVGDVYSTDIVAYIDGMPVDSYNIGGRTAVALEDLKGYGFSVYFRDPSFWDVRLLSDFTCVPSWSGPVRGRPGAIVGTVRSTAMKVFINDLEIPAYDIDGKTVVVMEDLGTANPLNLPLRSHAYSKYGFSCVWDQSKRSISLYRLKPGMEIRSDAGYYLVESVMTFGGISSGLSGRQFRLDGEAVLPSVPQISIRVSMQELEYYAPWMDIATALGLKWSRSVEDGGLVIESGLLSPLEAVTPAPSLSVQDYAGPFARVPLLNVKVSDRPAASYQVKAGVYDGKMYVRLDDIAKALDLVYAPLDGFYTRSDTPPCWEYGFDRELDQEWVLSMNPRWFTGGPHGGYLTTGYDATAPITIKFARAMDATTLNSKNVVVYVTTPSDDRFYEYEVISEHYTYAYDREKRVLMITPSRKLGLPDGTRVTVAMKPSIADADGRHPANGMRVSFSVQR